MTANWNQKVIEEFRENEGEVGGAFAGLPLLLLRHRGARTGTERVTPLAYQEIGESAVAIFASKGGAETNPDWYHNIRANPDVQVEVGGDVFDGLARVAEGEERHEIWERQKVEWPGFADYERKTSREIPVVVIEGLTVSGGTGA